MATSMRPKMDVGSKSCPLLPTFGKCPQASFFRRQSAQKSIILCKSSSSSTIGGLHRTCAIQWLSRRRWTSPRPNDSLNVQLHTSSKSVADAPVVITANEENGRGVDKSAGRDPDMNRETTHGSKGYESLTSWSPTEIRSLHLEIVGGRQYFADPH
jgi:hypothetical protein